MPIVTGFPRYFVVRRGEAGIYGSFRKDFEESGLAGIVWDRRIGERRRQLQAIAIERRHGERRRPLPRTWDIFGFVLVSGSPTPPP